MSLSCCVKLTCCHVAAVLLWSDCSSSSCFAVKVILTRTCSGWSAGSCGKAAEQSEDCQLQSMNVECNLISLASYLLSTNNLVSFWKHPFTACPSPTISWVYLCGNAAPITASSAKRLTTPCVSCSYVAVWKPVKKWTRTCERREDLKKLSKGSDPDRPCAKWSFSWRTFSAVFRAEALNTSCSFSTLFIFMWLESRFLTALLFQSQPKPGAKPTVSREEAKKSTTLHIKSLFSHPALDTSPTNTLKHPTSH